MNNTIYTDRQLALMRMWQQDKLKRINILEGSVSSGKTWISLVLWAFWVKTMPNEPDCLYLMGARSITTLKRNCLLLLQSLIGKNNFDFTISSKEGYLFGRHIILEGANDVQAEAKIRGLTLQGAYLDEITKLNKEFFAMLLSRLRKPGAKLIGTTNPDAPGHWLKTDYLDRADELDLMDMTFHIDDNTTLPEEYVENIKKEYVGVYYDRLITGAWVLAEGLIYPMYKDALQEVPEMKDRYGNIIKPDAYTVSLDYGTKNAFAALLWEKHDGIWYAVSEYYYSGRNEGQTKTDEEYAQDMDAWLFDVRPGERIETIVDPSAASFIALLQKRNHRYKVLAAENEVIDGIRNTATCMKRGTIKFSPRLKNWLAEIQGYVWDDSDVVDAPVKLNDHLMDAMRYMVQTKHLANAKNDFIPKIYK